jgi:hypothetical protein
MIESVKPILESGVSPMDLAEVAESLADSRAEARTQWLEEFQIRASGILPKRKIWEGVGLVLVASLFALSKPTVRLFYHIEVNYNEGWNAYNALAAVHHQLYPPAYNWTDVNYPSLSFYLIGYLSRFLGHPLMLGRVI